MKILLTVIAAMVATAAAVPAAADHDTGRKHDAAAHADYHSTSSDLLPGGEASRVSEGVSKAQRSGSEVQNRRLRRRGPGAVSSPYGVMKSDELFRSE